MAPDGAGPHARFITFVTDRPGHDHRYAIDASQDRARARLAAASTFDQGLRRDRALVPRQRGWWEPIAGRYLPRLTRLGTAS